MHAQTFIVHGILKMKDSRSDNSSGNIFTVDKFIPFEESNYREIRTPATYSFVPESINDFIESTVDIFNKQTQSLRESSSNILPPVTEIVRFSEKWPHVSPMSQSSATFISRLENAFSDVSRVTLPPIQYNDPDDLEKRQKNT